MDSLAGRIHAACCCAAPHLLSFMMRRICTRPQPPPAPRTHTRVLVRSVAAQCVCVCVCGMTGDGQQACALTKGIK
jgi:hypothetical protein